MVGFFCSGWKIIKYQSCLGVSHLSLWSSFFGSLYVTSYIFCCRVAAIWQSRNQWGTAHLSRFRTSGFLQQGWSRFLNLHQWPLKYPFKGSASWYFSIASLVEVKLVKKIWGKCKKAVKLDHFPMDRGWKIKEKMETSPSGRKRSRPNGPPYEALRSWPNIGPLMEFIGTISQIFCFFSSFWSLSRSEMMTLGYDAFFLFVGEGWCNIYNTPRKTASVKLAGLSVTLTGTSSPESVSQKKRTSFIGIIYTWNPNDLYFWRSTPQNKALFNQNKGHLGSRYIYIYNSTSTWRSFLKLQPFQISLAPHTVLPSSAWSEGLASPLWWALKMMIEI